MARQPKPWYWKQRKVWCAYIGGKKHILGSDKKDATQRFHELMGASPARPAPADENAVISVLDDFMHWTLENRAKKTYDRYRDFLNPFGIEYGRLSVNDLSTAHVTTWLSKQKTWNSTTKRNAITALKRGFNWAVRNRGLTRNPLQGMEKPQAKRRKTIVPASDFQIILDHTGNEHFKKLLIVSYDSGARPQEVKRLEARHVDLERQRAVIPADEAKGEITRAIYFPTDRSIQIVRSLMDLHPTGSLFRNSHGKAWTAYTVKCRLSDIRIAIGRAEMVRQGIESQVTPKAILKLAESLPKIRVKKNGEKVPKTLAELKREARIKLVGDEAKKYAPSIRHYDMRRTFITAKIKAGVDSHVVAGLAGHKSTAMIDKHYSAIADDPDFMLSQAKAGT